MVFHIKWVILFGLSLLYTIYGANISNLSGSCIRCLCHVTGCDLNRGCSDGYCGPYYISRVYWTDADKPTLPDDVPERIGAYEDCAIDYHCSIKIVRSYMTKFGKDCNGDGVTDCFDYMMMNYHGGVVCSKPLFLSSTGLKWLKRYEECQIMSSASSTSHKKHSHRSRGKPLPFLR